MSSNRIRYEQINYRKISEAVDCQQDWELEELKTYLEELNGENIEIQALQLLIRSRQNALELGSSIPDDERDQNELFLENLKVRKNENEKLKDTLCQKAKILIKAMLDSVEIDEREKLRGKIYEIIRSSLEQNTSQSLHDYTDFFNFTSVPTTIVVET